MQIGRRPTRVRACTSVCCPSKRINKTACRLVAPVPPPPRALLPPHPPCAPALRPHTFRPADASDAGNPQPTPRAPPPLRPKTPPPTTEPHQTPSPPPKTPPCARRAQGLRPLPHANASTSLPRRRAGVDAQGSPGARAFARQAPCGLRRWPAAPAPPAAPDPLPEAPMTRAIRYDPATSRGPPSWNRGPSAELRRVAAPVRSFILMRCLLTSQVFGAPDLSPTGGLLARAPPPARCAPAAYARRPPSAAGACRCVGPAPRGSLAPRRLAGAPDCAHEPPRLPPHPHGKTEPPNRGYRWRPADVSVGHEPPVGAARRGGTWRARYGMYGTTFRGGWVIV
jgi:hypothetical protein